MEFDPHLPLEILYQDAFLVAVHKPTGLLVHKGMGAPATELFLLQLLRDQIGQWLYPIHRLDRPTSGIVLFALDAETAHLMQILWQSEGVTKIYEAIVRGWVDEHGHCKKSLKNPENENWQESWTEWHTLERISIPKTLGKYPEIRYSWLKLWAHTGRWHQLRRHLSSLNHPILGDTVHGDRHHNHFWKDEKNWWRLMLVAQEIEFLHPHTSALVHLKLEERHSLSPYWQNFKSYL